MRTPIPTTTSTLSLLAALLLPLLPPPTHAATLQISIPTGSPLLPHPSLLPASTHATLLGRAGSGPHYTARLNRANELVFSDVEVGEYLLDVFGTGYVFPPFRVDVFEEESEEVVGGGGGEGEAVGGSGAGAGAGAPGEERVRGEKKKNKREVIRVHQTFRGSAWADLGPKFGDSSEGANDAKTGGGGAVLKVSLGPSMRRDFYQRREGFNIMSFFKNPMILMGLASVALIFGMPYVMDNMDDETKAEFEAMQSKSPITGSQGAASQIQNFDLASWMAGKSEAGASSGASAGAGDARSPIAKTRR